MARPLITLLTDFGYLDHYVGAMKGVMAAICPDAAFVDITHDIPAYGIREAAFALSQAAKYFPSGTVHLVVVDPGVGGPRRPILAQASGQSFVAPDNGVLSMALAETETLVVRAISNSRFFRSPTSQTFHGRDIFAPVAAHLASGVPAEEFGPQVNDMVRLELPPAGSLAGVVLKVDRYGNIVTSLGSDLVEKEQLGRSSGWRLEIGAITVTAFRESYVEAGLGELFLIAGSSGYLEVSLNQASAAEATRVRSGDPVKLLPSRNTP